MLLGIFNWLHFFIHKQIYYIVLDISIISEIVVVVEKMVAAEVVAGVADNKEEMVEVMVEVEEVMTDEGVAVVVVVVAADMNYQASLLT